MRSCRLPVAWPIHCWQRGPEANGIEYILQINEAPVFRCINGAGRQGDIFVSERQFCMTLLTFVLLYAKIFACWSGWNPTVQKCWYS
jgi:hypothetical protein